MADVDIEALGLLDGLEGEAREERAELIAWLLDRGFSIDHIRDSVAAPLMLPAFRVLGDDGELVSAREICESTGVELELLQRLQRAIGLPRIDDPDAAVLLRADGEAAARAKLFLDLGIGPEDTVAVMRVLVESLDHAAAIMREAGLKAVLRPGSTEIELAEGTEQLALKSAPSLGSVDGRPDSNGAAAFVRDGGRQRRRASGRHATGCATGDHCLRRPCRVHPPRRVAAARGA